MAVKKSQYSILVGVDLDTTNIKQQLKDIQSKLKPIDLTIKDSGKTASNLEAIAKSTKEVGINAKTTTAQIEQTSLSVQAANEIFRTSIDIIASMVEQVYNINAAQIEFQKVSDLSGQALEKYIDQLGVLGGSVARTTSEMLDGAT